MDEATALLLSRYLDDDLEDEALRRLEERLEKDEALAAELRAMRELQHAVRDLARSTRAPVNLDALVEPLRRGHASTRRVRPAVRWLAAAAGMVVGVTVTLEVARRMPAPEAPPIPSPANTRIAEDSSESNGYFQLQPLPRFVDENGEESLGAADRLLATPHPDPEVELPEALDALGPLQEEVDMEAARIAGEPGGESQAASSTSKTSDSRVRAATKGTTQEREGLALEGRSLGKARMAQQPKETVPGLLTIVVAGERRSLPLPVEKRASTESYKVIVIVTGGKVQGIEPSGIEGDVSAPIEDTLIASLLGVAVPDIPDGVYSATVTVGTEVPPATEPRGDDR